MNRQSSVITAYSTSQHHFKINLHMAKNQDSSWLPEMNAIIKSGGVHDCYFKAVLKKQGDGKFILRVYGVNAPMPVNIPLNTKSESRAKKTADNYLESINAINGDMNEFEL